MPGSNNYNLPRQISKKNSDTLILESCLFYYVCRKKPRKRRTINTQLSYTDWQRKCLQEQVIYHGKANQKYGLIFVFKPFLLVSMIQRLSKKLGNSTTLGNYGLCPAALI
ncbi:hypothetical protein D9S65_22940 [Escherichia coli]|nr:hypothetical protein [Escherichia coli]EGO8824560.1 hypothetical protein [Escherichia coli]